MFGTQPAYTSPPAHVHPTFTTSNFVGMEYAPANLNLAELRRKMDITDLTIQIQGINIYSVGRFCVLWRDGNFLVIQAEPRSRSGLEGSTLPLAVAGDEDLEEQRALCYTREVIQTMLDDIVIDGKNNWAYLVRLPKSNAYRLVYRNKRFIRDCTIWKMVVELDDIEVTRFTSGLCWEGIYEGKDVDLFIGWDDSWGAFVSAESRGQKLVEFRSLGSYFFELKEHVAKNGVIVGIMMEALVGRSVTFANRPAVYEAFADLQRHGVLLSVFQISDIYITEKGVCFASASSAKYYSDRDELARESEYTWETLEDIFTHLDDNVLSGYLIGSRSTGSNALIIPRLPSPSRPVALTVEELIIRWVWLTTLFDVNSCREADTFREFARHGKPVKALCYKL